jgi:hypothetical protein
MDFHALQHKLFEMDPVDPAEDKRRMMSAAQGGAVGDVPPTKDYVNESVEVPQGSMPLGLDSIADFAALAGVRVNEAQKHGDYARGKDPMPSAEPGRTKHPLKDKLVGEEEDPFINAIDQSFGQSSVANKIGFSPTGELYKAIYRAIKSVMPEASEAEVNKAANAAARSMDESVVEDENTEQNPDIDKLIEKFIAKGMPKKAARMFAQIAYMHFNSGNEPVNVYPPRGDMEMDPSNLEPMSRESTTESIKDRLYAALKDYK